MNPGLAQRNEGWMHNTGKTCGWNKNSHWQNTRIQLHSVINDYHPTFPSLFVYANVRHWIWTEQHPQWTQLKWVLENKSWLDPCRYFFASKEDWPEHLNSGWLVKQKHTTWEHTTGSICYLSYTLQHNTPGRPFPSFHWGYLYVTVNASCVYLFLTF